MKRLLALSMRVVTNEAYPEERDAVAKDWYRFLAAALPDTVPLLLPNSPAMVRDLLDATDPAGLILSGGNDVGSCAARDQSEALALSWMMERGRPVAGVCRGMQFLVRQTGGNLVPVAPGQHVGTRHRLSITERLLPPFVGRTQPYPVNSYHAFEAQPAPDSLLKIWGVAADGAVEAVYAPEPPLLGIMWHPEREEPCHPFDLALFAGHFNK